MVLNPIKTNMTEITFELKGQSAKVLFSYKTPVALCLLTENGMEYYVTGKHRSSTTSRHINNWIPKDGRIERDQEWFDNLIAEVK